MNQLEEANKKIEIMTALLEEVMAHRFICCGTLAPIDEWDDLIKRIKEVIHNGNSNQVNG